MGTHIHAYRAINRHMKMQKKRFLEDDDDDDEKKSPHL
jgi:cbb3-type cytochrome oxidase subunit 3